MSEDTTDDDDGNPIIGTRAPPAVEQVVRNRAGQFMKGSTANRRGRPRNCERSWSMRQLNTNAFEELNRPVTIRVNGKSVRVTMYQLILRGIFEEAARKNPKAIKLSLEIAKDAASLRHHLDRDFQTRFEALERNVTLAGKDSMPEDVYGFIDFQRKKSRRR